MSSESFRFEVGTFQCILIEDAVTAYPYPAQMFFTNAPKELLEQALREHGTDPQHWNACVCPYPSILISTGRHQVLVDTGAGNLLPTTGNLIPKLRIEGIAPEDIDTVILTHCHRDHIGGTTDSEGKPAFPNARYVMWREEWEFWTAPEPDWGPQEIAEEFKTRWLACVRDNSRRSGISSISWIVKGRLCRESAPYRLLGTHRATWPLQSSRAMHNCCASPMRRSIPSASSIPIGTPSSTWRLIEPWPASGDYCNGPWPTVSWFTAPISPSRDWATSSRRGMRGSGCRLPDFSLARRGISAS